MPQRKHNKYDDLLGFLGGGLCLWLSEVDVKWGLFWLVAGVILILWSAVSFFGRRRGKS